MSIPARKALPSPLHALLAALITIGLSLRVWQYLADMSLWFDELSIARNVRERSLEELVLHPLAYNQIAPPGFLMLVKGSTILFGWSDFALRLFPLVCGITALFLFWRVAVRVLDGTGVPVAVGLFALGMPFVRYTAELKQYGMDVVAALVLTLVALDLRASPPTTRRCMAAGLAGLAIVWFSQAAVFVMAGLGIAFVVGWLAERDPATRRPVMITVPIWALASLAALIVSMLLVTPKTLAFMHAFWRSRLGFFPLPPSARDTLWLWDRIVQLFGDKMMLGYPWPMLFTGLAILGFVVTWRRRRDVALILLGPFVVTIAAAVAQQYPFRTRVVLFLVPTLLLAVSASVEWIRARLAMVHPILGWAVLIAFVGPPVYAVWVMPPPYYVEAFKPVLAFVQSHRRAGDAVYVHPNAYEAMDHYGAQFGLPGGTYVLGTCDERNIRSYLRDVDSFRGSARVWVIGSSVPSFSQPRKAIGRYLETIGLRRASLVIPSRPPLDPVSAELFDMSDAKRLQAATASTFAVRAIADTLHPFCQDWIRPTPMRPGARE